MLFLHQIFDCLANLLLWVLFIFLAGPILCLLFLWRISVVWFARIFSKDLYPTIPNDTNFAIDSSANMPIVNAAQIWRIQGLINLEEFKNHFHKCFLESEERRERYRNFYCYLVRYGGFVFKKAVKSIELEKHIYEVKLSSETSLEEFIAEYLFVKTFRDKSPLWELILIPLPLNCDTEEHETILILKVNHCLADGYTFVHIVDTLTGNTSPYLVKEESDTIFEKIKVAFQTPKKLLDLCRDVCNTQDIFYPLKTKDPKWYISFATMNLDDVKKIRRQTKTHFVTIMMSLMIGALHRLLLEKLASKDIPSHIWTANSLPWPKHPRDTMTNHWSGGLFKVPFQCANALERLKGTEAFFNNYLDNMNMHKSVKRMFIPLTWCFPSFLLKFGHSLDLYYFKYSNAFASLMLSNEKHYLLGKNVRNIYLPLALKDCVPCSVLFGVSTSHSNQMDISLTANSEIIPDQDTINRLTQVYFQQELDELNHIVSYSNHNDAQNDTQRDRFDITSVEEAANEIV